MKAYADTGLLCSLYAPDAHIVAAVARMARMRDPLPLIWLHQLELRNALRLRVFRGEITAVQRDAALNAFLADAAGGIYAPANPVLGDVMMEAERLSASHSDKLGTRSLDILHVATALVLGGSGVLDLRQAAGVFGQGGGAEGAGVHVRLKALRATRVWGGGVGVLAAKERRDRKENRVNRFFALLAFFRG